MNKYRKNVIPLIFTIILLSMMVLACSATDIKNEIKGVSYHMSDLIDDLVFRQKLKEEHEQRSGDIQDDSALISPSTLNQSMSDNVNNLPLKPVGFVNYGTINATVRPWTYIPLGGQEYQTPSFASTVSSAQGTGGSWPNSSRFILVPMGTYTWCIDWEEEDKDGDGYFDTYHYFETVTTLLDENDSDELEFAEEVAIMAPPTSAPIYRGKCGDEDLPPKYIWVEVGEGDCVGIDVDSSDGFGPEDSKAMPGITAICWDNGVYTNFTERVFCTYKSISWDECTGGPNIGKMFTAVEVN
jgi:hypothetical protein